MHLLLAAFLALVGLQGTPPTGTASVEGVVTKAGTSQPVANASVVIWCCPFSPEFEATTDGNGHFVVSKMPAGIFHVEVKADGYLSYPLPNRVSSIRLSDGQRLRQDVVLSANSSISGRIVDDNREPVADATVDLLQQSRDSTGRLSWQAWRPPLPTRRVRIVFNSLFAIELKSMDEAVPVLGPEFLSAYQNRGAPIRVEKGATVTTAPLSLISR